MAKSKEIQYPTQEWLDKWIDKWLDKHPNEKVSDFNALTEKATDAWWDNEIDHGNPTPYDLTKEQEKVSKEARGTSTRKAPTVYKFDTASKTKKKDDEKEAFVAKLHEIVAEFTENCVIANPNREITFNLGENSYSLVLTKHGNKKK